MRNPKSFELAALLFVGVLVPYGCDAGDASGPDRPSGSSAQSGPGSGGGSPTSTGAGATSAASTGSGVITPLPENVIDDLEDGNGVIVNQGGRKGAWYTYNDETSGAMQTPEAGSMFLPVMGGAASTLNSANTVGSGFTTWGAGMGFDLNNEGDTMGGPGVKNIYDASAFQGIVFYAKGTVPSVRVKVAVEAVVLDTENGTCTGGTTMCNDAHGKIIALTQEWQQYAITWPELLQEGWGTVATFDPATLMQIQFQSAANMTFDFSVDDVAFF